MLEDAGGRWRALEVAGGRRRALEVAGGRWRTPEAAGGHWMRLEQFWRLLDASGALLAVWWTSRWRGSDAVRVCVLGVGGEVLRGVEW